MRKLTTNTSFLSSETYLPYTCKQLPSKTNNHVPSSSVGGTIQISAVIVIVHY